MRDALRLLLSMLQFWLKSRAQPQLEILALRHRLTVLQRQQNRRPRLTSFGRVFWVWLYRLWPDCLDALAIMKPETVVRWHREGFRKYWRWKSRIRGPGRPAVPLEIRNLIRRTSQENPLSQASVSKYMLRHPRPPSQTWRTFLRNHVGCLVSVDFFTVPTTTFAILFVFIVLRHDRRGIVHVAVTAQPTALWVAQQIREAFPWNLGPRYLIRDRDGVYGATFRATVAAMGIEEIMTAPRSPWQNPYVERVIGSIGSECLNQIIVLNERHLRRILASHLDYYHRSRTHLSLGKDCPEPRPAQPPGQGKIIAFPQVGGLHHRYERLAA